MSEFQKLSARYNLGTYLKTALLTQFIAGLCNPIAQAELLDTSNLTFEKAVTVATTLEFAESITSQLRKACATTDYVYTVNSCDNKYKGTS